MGNANRASTDTLSAFRAAHFRIERAEQWVPNPQSPAGGVRRDLFGVIDYLAIRPGVIVGVQATTIKQVSPHNKKIREEKRAAEWIEAGGILVMLAWGTRNGSRYARVFRYRLNRGAIATDEYTTLRDAIPEMLKT